MSGTRSRSGDRCSRSSARCTATRRCGSCASGSAFRCARCACRASCRRTWTRGRTTRRWWAVEFDNTFTVQAPVDEVYEALLDVERVAPAMPGAQVLEKTGDDSYKVAIKVKLGPISMTYRGDVTIVERDPEAHSAALDVKAKEARGQGTANAKVSMAVEPDGDGAQVRMKTTVQLSGKAASMSRGVIDDVSKRLVATFAENLEGILAPRE